MKPNVPEKSPDSLIKCSTPVCTQPQNQVQERQGLLAETGSANHIAPRSVWNGVGMGRPIPI